LVSQADADAKAQNDKNTNGQNYANAHGLCGYVNDAMSKIYTKSCVSGGTPSSITYSVAAGTYSSSLSHDDANAQALAHLEEQGRYYLLYTATCTFYNVSMSQSFTRNNCVAGGTGSSVPYNVPAGRYSSTISQADANAQAQNDINSNGQGNANQNGNCTFYSVSMSQSFTRNNCDAGGTGSSVPYNVPAGRYSSAISQEDANAQAQNEINTYGQNTSNQNGSCTYYNYSITSFFTKNDCGPGGSASTVTYFIPAATYSSLVSQADADAKAQNDKNTNGQNYANAHGVCGYISDAMSKTYTKTCASGGIPSNVTFSVAAGTYSSSVSHDDANAQALAHLEEQGRYYLLYTATCTFYNATRSQVFTRNDCGAGQFGTNVTYTIAPDTYLSTSSQADADTQAQNDINKNGQNFANQNGGCSVPEIPVEGSSTISNATFQVTLTNTATGTAYANVLHYSNPPVNTNLFNVPAGTYNVSVYPLAGYSGSYAFQIGTYLFTVKAKANPLSIAGLVINSSGDAIILIDPIGAIR
jgi:hypothetical protein